MGIYRGPYQGQGYIYDGVILSLDAADTRSYPGTGSTWFDLSPIGNDQPLAGGLTTSNIGGAIAMNLDADGKKVLNGPLAGQTQQKEFSMESWYYPAASELPTSTDSYKTIIQLTGGSQKFHSWRTTLRLNSYSYNTSPPGYHHTGAAVPRETWCHMATVYDLNDSKCYQWTNGVKTFQTTSGTPLLNTGVYLMGAGANRQLSGGVAVLRVYNRALTDEEVLFNFNNSRRRFGI